MRKIEVDALMAQLPLGEGHPHQERAVRRVLDRLLNAGQTGMILADEVGCGKTYEALAVMALLWRHSKAGKAKPPQPPRVLILCKSSLLAKWESELQSAAGEKGFPQYLREPEGRWAPLLDGRNSLKSVSVPSLAEAKDLEDTRQGRGKRKDGHNQASEGIWLVNDNLLADVDRRGHSRLLRMLWRTKWDLVIADEAHHHGKKNACARVFTPDLSFEAQDLARGLQFRRILLLTATPFELDPEQMVNLLRIIWADENDVELILQKLKRYEKVLKRFYAARNLPPPHDERRRLVDKLQGLRGVDGATKSEFPGLEVLLRKYLVRNVKDGDRRRYSFVEQVDDRLGVREFSKYEDLRGLVSGSPLLPFQGLDELFYLELRELIQATFEEKGASAKASFVTTDLRQGLSSYPQALKSALLQRPEAARLRGLVEAWDKPANGQPPRIHPKVRALRQLVAELTDFEANKLLKSRQGWFSKILVFNKLVAGTAPHLKAVLEDVVSKRVRDLLRELVRDTPWREPERLRRAMSQSASRQLGELGSRLAANYDAEAILDSLESLDSPRFKRGAEGKTPIGDLLRGKRTIIGPFEHLLQERSRQELFLIRFLLRSSPWTLDGIDGYVKRELLGARGDGEGDRAGEGVEGQLEAFAETLSGVGSEGKDRAKTRQKATRTLHHLRQQWANPDLVARFDGATQDDRQAHLLNFNDYYSPLVLIVSKVGEEGIDLQRHCRYIVHYDLEWNPAKMEQREGRVDRVGWLDRRTPVPGDENYIDVRFMLLKGTYEERIFHTVMERDLWFQVLLGSTKRELGKSEDLLDNRDEDENPMEEFGLVDMGRITQEEQQAIMFNLVP